MSTVQMFDLIVIGGGVNGAGIARDAQGRGLKTLLVEKDDLAQHTSSASTKLIHGGLRYLEYYEFSLVRKALQEREVLLKSAPHIMHPMRFVMPHDPSMRPAWMIKVGLWFYDHLAKREILPASKGINLMEHTAGNAIKGQFKKGFEYSDGWVDDARLVALCAIDAHQKGAQIRTRCQAIGATRHTDHWEVELQDNITQVKSTVQTRAVINAAGPWVSQVLKNDLGINSKHSIRLIKGSHIVVNKLFDHDYAYIFQNPDQRIIFAIPYEQNYTLIGTTDLEFNGDTNQVQIDPAEIEYLCDMSNRYFNQQITPAQVVHTYSGVRPLVQESGKSASAVTRDYWLELDQQGAPLLSVFGGKITTFRKLAEQAVNDICKTLGHTAPAWTEQATLPGGDIPQKNIQAFIAQLQTQYPNIAPKTLGRLAHAYGDRCMDILNPDRLGQEIAPGVFEGELHYLCQNEWVKSADDMLWRRSKLGLHLNAESKAAIKAWIAGINYA